MGMIEAVPPPIPAAPLAMSSNSGTAVVQAAGVAGVVPGVAINSAAAGVLFGVMMTQLAAGMSQSATGKETDAKAPKDSKAPQDSESQTQTSPEATSVLASLVPFFVSVSEPQPSNSAAAATTNAVSVGGNTLTPLALTTLTAAIATNPSVEPDLSTLDTAGTANAVSDSGGTLTPLALGTPTAAAATSSSADPALSMLAQLTNPPAAGISNTVSGVEAAQPDLSTGSLGPGKVLDAALVENQVPVADDTQAGTPQVPVSGLASIHAQGQGIQTIFTTIQTTGEWKNPGATATASDTGADLGQALSSPVASIDKKSDQLQTVLPSVLIDATLTRKKDESRDDVRVVDLTPTGNEKIPAEFLAGPAPSLSTSTASAEPVAKTAVVANDAPAAITPRETIHLQLSPSDLGRLTLHVSVQSQQVQATVGVEHRGLGEFLTAGQGALDGAMRQHGLRLEELHIETLGNPDLLGAGGGRTGLLDHGQPRQDSPGFDREPLTRPGPESEVSIMRADILEPLGSRHRINLFA